MNFKLNKLRYERKFLLDDYIIRSEEDLNTYLSIEILKQFPKRRINSIYYDSINFALANDTFDGSLERKKIRIRYYGHLDKILLPKLEIKKKYGLTGEKKIFDLDTQFLYKNDFDLINYKFAELLNIFDLNLIKLIEPKLIISYERDYFISKCKKYRLTLDSNIIFKIFVKQDSKYNFQSNWYVKFNKKVIEIKYNRFDDKDAHLLTRNLPARISSFSKYIMALRYLGLLKI